MSLVNASEDDALDLIMTNVDWPNVGDAAGLQNSATAGSAQIALATVDYVDTDTLLTADEAAYTSYARQTVARSTAGWTVSSGTCDNDAAITFPQATGGSETEVAVGIGLRDTGDVLQMYGGLTSDLAVSNGITPEFAAGALDISIA